MKKTIRYPAWKFVVIYFKIRAWWPVWFYVLNRHGRRLFCMNAPQLNSVQQRILHDLNENGIAVAHIDELFPATDMLEKFKDYAHKSIEEKKKLGSSKPDKASKPFLTYLFDPVPAVDMTNPFFHLAFEKTVLDIITSYFQMYVNFFYMTLNITLPIGGDRRAIGSQRWHRDPEDRKMCKMFLYLTDVDEESGPFMYVEKSKYGRKWGKYFPQRPPIGYYPDQKELEELIPKEDIKICTGKAGTLLFCDTSGLHKGGYALTRPRMMLTLGFRLRASVTPHRIRVGEEAAKEWARSARSPAVAYALEQYALSNRTRNLFGLFRRWNKIYRPEKFED